MKQWLRLNIGIVLSGTSVFFFSCVTTNLPEQVKPDLAPYYGSSYGTRGTIIDALPLKSTGLDEALPFLDPTTVSLVIKPDLLIKKGFFSAASMLKSSFVRVRQIRLRYWSVDPTGRPIQVSGLLLTPEYPRETKHTSDLLLLNHGTQLVRNRVPSQLYGPERLVGLVAAATGLTVILPDYPGLGDSEGFHPYCLLDSLGASGIDAMRAARQWVAEAAGGSVSLGNRVYVSGYSEGGYAAMAVMRHLAQYATSEFAITAAYSLAVPADMSNTMRNLMTGNVPASSPYYLLYTLLGWRLYYPEFPPIETLLKPEVVKEVLPLMDGWHTSSEVNAKIAEVQGVKREQAIASKMLSENGKILLEALSDTDGSNILSSILTDNDLLHWPADAPAPTYPIYLAASPSDELVPFVNSQLMLEELVKLGCTVELITLSPNKHGDAGIEAYGLMLHDIWIKQKLISRE